MYWGLGGRALLIPRGAWAGSWAAGHCQRSGITKTLGEGAHPVNLYSADLGRSQLFVPEGQISELCCRSQEEPEELGKGRIAKAKVLVKYPLWVVQAQTSLRESEMY